MSAANVETLMPDAAPWSIEAAKELAADSGRRDEIPVRRSFLRNEDPDADPPLAKLIASGGRGGAVPVKLYLALVWRCSSEPFNTDILARKWAALLGLDEPNTLGARRVTKALDVLEREHLVRLDRRRGESTVVTLLDESGSGAAYTLPSTASALASETDKPFHRYFKVPLALWTEGHIQSMSASALAMLLVLLAERNPDGRRTWWSTERFPRLFALSSSVRSKGTSELVDRGLVHVKKELVSGNTATAKTFSRQRVRSTYKLMGDARPVSMVEQERAARKTVKLIRGSKARKRPAKKKSSRAQ